MAGTEVSRQFRIGPAPHDKGPCVYLDYDQIELDAAYDQAAYAPQREQIIERLTALSDAARERLGAPERLRYGPSAAEYLDLYRAAPASAPVFIFVHGGAWKSSDPHRNAFAAELFVNAGIHFALLEFVDIAGAGGALPAMAAGVCSGIEWLRSHAASLGIDQQRMFLGGHSSGAHLASAALATGLHDRGLPDRTVKGALLCSGIYDLEPVRLSKRSSYVAFDEPTVDRLSALRYVERFTMPLVIAYGTEETPEFQRQGRVFFEALSAAGKPARSIVATGYNHFDIIESLGNPYGLLGRAALDLVTNAPSD
jgi:arylformamidase